MCVRCEAMEKTIEVRSPGQLRSLIADIASMLEEGVLSENPASAAQLVSGEQVPFQDLVAGKPGGDVLDYRFCCTACGTRFRLGVETYHGAGGSWRVMDV